MIKTGLIIFILALLFVLWLIFKTENEMPNNKRKDKN